MVLACNDVEQNKEVKMAFLKVITQSWYEMSNKPVKGNVLVANSNVYVR